MLMLIAIAEPCVHARLLRRTGKTQSSRIALRRRLHVSPLITDPGTVETEFNGAFTDSAWSMPSTFKWTPEGTNLVWGRTEYSAGLDVLTSNDGTHTTDHLSLTGTTLILDGDHWNFAVAPTLTFGFRDQEDLRAGMTAITRYDFGRNSAGSTLTWTSNPGTWDFGSGFGHTFGTRTTVHADSLYERARGYEGAWSFFEGFELQMTQAIAVDLSAQHLNLTGGATDHQALIGLTINFGRPSTWFHRH